MQDVIEIKASKHEYCLDKKELKFVLDVVIDVDDLCNGNGRYDVRNLTDHLQKIIVDKTSEKYVDKFSEEIIEKIDINNLVKRVQLKSIEKLV